MGLFLAVSTVVASRQSDVITALAEYAKSKNGIFMEEARSTNLDDTLVIHSSNGNTSLLFPQNSLDWWDISEALSRIMGKTVFAFHIHDGDFWMYSLYKNGVQIDAFNPIPDYWSDNQSAQEREANKGNADIVSKCIAGARPEDIEKYLVTWDLEEEISTKAYPEDENPYGTDWQLLDFMKKLGLPYPVNETGQALGPTYRFNIPIPKK